MSLDLRSPADAVAVARMAGALAHRGPDDRGFHADGPVALGHTRLSILDTSAAGRQPFLSADGRRALVLNGEIYNFLDLRANLERSGHRFRTGTDTEVALAAYLAYGAEFLKRLEGMFALAIWDAVEGRLLLARDPAGIKPLYVAEWGGALWFASELRALLEGPPIPRDLAPPSVAHYFARQYVGGEPSIVAGVSRLPAGTALLVSGSGTRRERFWSYPLAGAGTREGRAASATPPAGSEARDGRRGSPGERTGRDPAESAERLRALLSDAVLSHLQSDVPVGVFLSGGIDSSVIAALLARHGVGSMPAFTIAIEGAGLDETSEAGRVAASCGLEHHAIPFGPRDALDELPRLAAALDEPLADYAILPTAHLARYARRHVTVVLSGEGADEVFGGYPRYLHYLRNARRARLPLVGAAARRECADFAATRLFDRAALARLLAPLAPGGPTPSPAAVDLLSPDANPEDAHAQPGILARFAGLPAIADSPGGLVNRMLAIDFAGWLPDDLLTKVDRATMLSGLEARVPYLDRAVIEHVAALHGTEKISGNTLKAILRRAAAGLVPAETIARPKHGFTVPVGPWLRGELRPLLRDTLASAAFRTRGVVDPLEAERLLDGLDRRGANGLRLWSLLVFELWCRATLDPPATA